MRITTLYLIPLFWLLGIITQSQAQTAADRLYRKATQFEDAYKLDVQGPLIKTGLKIAEKELDDDVERQILDLARHIKRLKILIVPDSSMQLIGGDYKSFVSDLRSDSFEDFLTVRHKDARVHFMVREKRKKIRNILLLVDSDEAFVMINMKTKLPVEELANLELSL
jgi:hypothetical protein